MKKPLPIRLIKMLSIGSALAVSAMATMAAIAAPADSTRTTGALQADQMGYAIGDGKLLVSQLGVKWFSAKSQVYLLCCPPRWDVRILNKKTHTCTTVSLKAFKGFYFNQAAACGGIVVSHVPLPGRSKTHFGNWPAELCTSDEAFEKEQLKRFAKKEIFGWDAISLSVTILQPGACNPAPEAIEVVSKLYGLPALRGIPVSCTVGQAWPKSYTYLRTRGITRTTVSPADYVAPVGYARKNSIAEVTSDMTSAFTDMSEMFETRKPAKQ